MQAGSLRTGDVLTPTSTVLVDGVARPHVSWSVDRELSGDLPAQVTSVSGIQQATGSIVWATTEDVARMGDNPWNPQGWWPQKGARVQIFAGDGVTEWSQFVGVIDSTSGSIGEAVTSRIIDDYDKLSAKVSHEAMLRVMPPLVDGAEWRGPGLTSLYYVDLAFRTAGFCTTPKQEPGTVLFAPMQGGSWPHVGTMATATSYEGTNRAPLNPVTPWGLGMGNGLLTYSPFGTVASGTPVQITLMVAPGHAAPCHVTVNYSSGSWVRLAANADRSVSAWTSIGGASAARCTLTATQMAGATVVTLLVKATAVSLRNDKGATASGTTAAISGTITNIQVTAELNAVVGGLMVSHPTETYLEHRPSLSWNPTAVIDTSSALEHVGTLQAARSIDGEAAVDVATEISEAVLSAFWIDELGKMRWKSSSAFRNQPTSGTLTTADDVVALGFEDNLLGSRSKITVKRDDPSITASKNRSVILWEGGARALTSGEVAEDIVSPGSDEDWIEIADFQRVGTDNWAPFNTRRGSFVGVYYSAADGSDTLTDDGLSMSITVEPIGVKSLKIVHTAGSYPDGVEANLGTSPTWATLWPRNRNLPLPRVAGGGKVQWVEVEIIPEGPFGVGPELVHEVGCWADQTIAGRIASYLQAQTIEPKPTINNLELIPDPRRQLGDSFIVSSPGLMGVNIRALVTSLSTSFDASNGLSQSASVRTIIAATLWQTFAQFNAAGGALTFQQWQALGPVPQKFEEFNAAI